MIFKHRIITAPELAEALVEESTRQRERGLTLGPVIHHEGFAEVELQSPSGKRITPKDAFWLGYHAALRLRS